jgi:hypothetical protein
MRRAIDAAAGLMPSEVMTFNAVLNADLNVVRAFAGDPVEAHAAAAGLAAGIYGLDLPGLADVVISGSRPMDRDWRQGVKCFGGPLFAVRPGGVLVAAMRCLEGLGDYRPPFYRPLPRWLVRAAARIPGMRGLLGLLARRGKGLDPENLHMVLYALQMVRRCRVIVCAPSIGREASALMPLFDFTQDMGEALAAAAAHVGRGKARLTVFPYGAVSYPILPGEEEAQ